MKIKYLLLVVLIFMMCGCTAEVNLDISEDKINESVDITFYQNIIYSKDIIKSSFRNYIPIYGSDVIVDTEPDLPHSDIKYYEKTETDLGSGYLFNYKYNFDIGEYREARTVKDGFRSYDISVDEDDQTISLSTDDDGILYFDDYPELEEVTINIKTDYLVEENNADSVDGNTYTWVFDKDSKKNINMVIDTTETLEERDSRRSTNTMIIFSIVLVIVVILLLLLVKYKKNNKI